MTRLSVNINKIATIRNARGGNNPDVIRMALDAERFGAQGITVHPRPDERHIRYSDVKELAAVVTTEFNIEGYPDENFLNLVTQTRPAQVTLVPDAPDVITSSQGWDTVKNAEFLKGITKKLKDCGIRVSFFVDPFEVMVDGAAAAGADRVELYTGPYAHQYHENPERAAEKYVTAAFRAKQMGLGVNAGHDLDLNNLRFLKNSIPFLDEVSIGHALICDALYYGMENTIQLYRRQLL
ncbi:MAG: pyridoxine 5'-phosphate synthase [Cyclobacteriaceae bacterium]